MAASSSPQDPGRLSLSSTPNAVGSQSQDGAQVRKATQHNSDDSSSSPALPFSTSLLTNTYQPIVFDTDPTTTIATQPIQIPTTSRDPNRVPTPVSARGERKTHLFPRTFSRTPSPHGPLSPSSPSKISNSSTESDNFSGGWVKGRRRSSSSNQTRRILSMHNEQYSGRYTPTSPLSPKFPPASRPRSPQPGAVRPGHARQTSRNLHMILPKYHPLAYAQHGSATKTSPKSHGPSISVTRASQPVQIDSPRMMRDKQREMLDGVRMSSMLAASAASPKPGSPRLDPLGSPKGAVTPLALEEGHDYFSVEGAGKPSPANSPGAKSHRSTRSDTSTGKEHASLKKQRKVDGVP